jgi:hypothetical protein
MQRPTIALALWALSVTACGGREGTAPGTTSGASSGVASSAASGASSGTTAGIVHSGSGAFIGSATAGTETGLLSGSSYAPCGAGASLAPVSFANQIMPLFQSSCSVGGTGPFASCHGDPMGAMACAPGGARQWFGPPSPPVTSAAMLAMIYNGFVGQPSNEDLAMDVVDPGDPTQSFLWYKLNNTQGALDMESLCVRGDLGDCGSAMPTPLTGATITLLPQADLDLVCNWIVQGAPLSPCPVGQGDQNGACAPCPSGEAVCGDLCVNEQTDSKNCGKCASFCISGAACEGGRCTCPSGETGCGGTCVDEQTDPVHCGSCGTPCPVGALCHGGTCGPCPTGEIAANGVCCPPGETGCGRNCVDEQTDPNNCGGCGTTCAAGAICQARTCACPSGGVVCNGGCVNTQTAPNNCGACGTTCPTGTTCADGVCGSCPAGGTPCFGACVNEQTDTNNCGSCGNLCRADASGMYCVAGVCTPN